MGLFRTDNKLASPWFWAVFSRVPRKQQQSGILFAPGRQSSSRDILDDSLLFCSDLRFDETKLFSDRFVIQLDHGNNIWKKFTVEKIIEHLVLVGICEIKIVVYQPYRLLVLDTSGFKNPSTTQIAHVLSQQ